VLGAFDVLGWPLTNHALRLLIHIHPPKFTDRISSAKAAIASGPSFPQRFWVARSTQKRKYRQGKTAASRKA